jgi:hypothetical protein
MKTIPPSLLANQQNEKAQKFDRAVQIKFLELFLPGTDTRFRFAIGPAIDGTARTQDKRERTKRTLLAAEFFKGCDHVPIAIVNTIGFDPRIGNWTIGRENGDLEVFNAHFAARALQGTLSDLLLPV